MFSMVLLKSRDGNHLKKKKKKLIHRLLQPHVELFCNFNKLDFFRLKHNLPLHINHVQLGAVMHTALKLNDFPPKKLYKTKNALQNISHTMEYHDSQVKFV